MSYHQNAHHRRSIRLQGYDYTAEGAYFLTICAHEREPLFGEVVGAEARLNACGEIVAEEWRRTAVVRPNVALDAFVVMPNHIHAILILKNGMHVSSAVGATRRVATAAPVPVRGNRPSLSSQSLGAVVGQFKSLAAKRINVLRQTPRAPVWQRNYYERVIRDDTELNGIRLYVADNPVNWTEDEHYRPK